jgi:Fe-S cluster assembly protein SufD
MIGELKYNATEELVELFYQNRSIYYESCPPVMNEARELAIRKFQEKGIPSRKNENYKYTDLRPVFQNDFSVVPRYVEHKVDLHDVFNCNVPQLDTHIILLINGWYYGRNRKVGDFPDGVICCSLLEAAKQYPILFEKYYNKLAGESDDPLANLNTSLAKDGLFFYIPGNVTIEKPIQVINLLNSKENTLAVQRNMFVCGKNSEATLVFCDHTLNHQFYILNNLSECFVEPNGKFNFFSIQNQHNGAVNNTHFFASLSENSNLLTNSITLNGGIVRNNLKIKLEGEHANASVNGLILADEKQHVDNFTSIDHIKPSCTSDQLYKNILNDQSSGVFAGQIHVFRDAQKTEAFQRNNNVLLSTDAEMNSKPQLIIEADDVRCSHGATTGRIDEDALFYLRTRGIGEQEARLMIMYAFADEVLSKISIAPLRESIEELVDKRLRGELSPCQHCTLSCSH